MSDRSEQDIQQAWHTYLTTGKSPKHVHLLWFESSILRPLIRRLPSDPRCRICYYPFAGIGGKLVRLALGIEPSPMNPLLCNVCERFAATYHGGAEVEASLLFADVRGSTGLAETMSALEFSRLISRFYQVTTQVLYRHNGMVEKLIGDQVMGFFVPGFAGSQHAQAAVAAGREILEATGHKSVAGPWIQIGIGVHTGSAYIGSVGMEGGGVDIAVLGDAANIGARVASQARAGQMILTEAARKSAGLEGTGLESCRLELKGRREPVEAWVLEMARK